MPYKDKEMKLAWQRRNYALKGRNRSPVSLSASYRWQEDNPEKVYAHGAVKIALRQQRLVKPTVCENCGKVGVIHAHHPDYSKPLDVIWLCASCHKKLHLTKEG